MPAKPPRASFTATLKKAKDMNAVGIEVPPDAVAALGTSKRPAVKVTLKGYTYRSTVAVMGGRFMVGVAAEHRAAAGVDGGDTLTVTLELDTEPRVTPVPADLKAALVKAKVRAAFDAAAPSKRKEWVRQVEDAKTPETRERRIRKVVDALKA